MLETVVSSPAAHSKISNLKTFTQCFHRLTATSTFSWLPRKGPLGSLDEFSLRVINLIMGHLKFSCVLSKTIHIFVGGKGHSLSGKGQGISCKIVVCAFLPQV